MTCSYNDIISQKHKNRNPFCIGIAVFVWRGRRDLNSRAGYPTYTLSRGASSPLEYFRIGDDKINYSLLRDGGGKGIRTLVGLLPNGFQDRLVMTASISLRMARSDATPVVPTGAFPAVSTTKHITLLKICQEVLGFFMDLFPHVTGAAAWRNCPFGSSPPSGSNASYY